MPANDVSSFIGGLGNCINDVRIIAFMRVGSTCGLKSRFNRYEALFLSLFTVALARALFSESSATMPLR